MGTLGDLALVFAAGLFTALPGGGRRELATGAAAGVLSMTPLALV